MSVRLQPFGESALLLQWPGGADAWPAVLATAEALRTAWPAGVLDLVPAIDSLLVCFDPLQADTARLAADLLQQAAESGVPAPPAQRRHTIAVRFGAADGPDLPEVAERLGLSEDGVIERMLAVRQRVLMIGFAPGYPYLGRLPTELVLPRRSTPRAAVPAGSLAIAAGMTGIYPARLPGGWHLIGRTARRLFDPQAEPPALLAPGDEVVFTSEV
jgi:5-oxoprolinase (ATP-hydrolysing) subunit B